jgi:diguanylate cyclase
MDNILDSLEDEDFDLDDLIESHNTKVIETERKDVDLDDYENESEVEDEFDLLDLEFEHTNDFGISEVNIENRAIEHKKEEEAPEDDELTIDNFPLHVLKQIKERGLPATPDNYYIYFHQLLESEGDELQKSFYQILDKERTGHNREDKKAYEDGVQISLQLTEQILNVTTKVHSNLKIMKNIIHKRDGELGSRKTKDIVKLLKFDLNKLDTILEKQSDSMKNLYGRSADIVNSIHEKTIFDRKFGTYNRRYFIDSIKNEIQKLRFFKHNSSLLLIIPHKSLTSVNLTPKVAFVISKTVAKILQQNTKRSDVVAYYGNNIFGIMLTHSDIERGREKILEFLEAFKESSLFIAGKEIEIKVKIGLAPLKSEGRVEDSLLLALDALKRANRSEDTVFEISK